MVGLIRLNMVGILCIQIYDLRKEQIENKKEIVYACHS